MFAKDISEKTKNKIKDRAKSNNIFVSDLPYDKYELGKIFRKKLTVVILIKNENFSSGIKSYL